MVGGREQGERALGQLRFAPLKAGLYDREVPLVQERGLDSAHEAGASRAGHKLLNMTRLTVPIQ